MNRGQVLGIVELGQTRLLNEIERCQDATQRSVASEVVGKYATEILGAWWLPRPLPEGGQPGVWNVSLPPDLIPEGVNLPSLSSVQAVPVAPRVVAEKEGPSLMPRLVVFDLDGVCWSPEMYQTRGGAPYRLVSNDVAVNSAGEEIKLHGAVLRVWAQLHDLQSRGKIRIAVASSSQRQKAQPLLSTFQIAPGTSMNSVVDPDFFQMYYRKGEGKRPHLMGLLQKSGVAPDEVLFIDDSRENIASVRDLGIVAVHAPYGLSEDMWARSLQEYRAEHAG